MSEPPKSISYPKYITALVLFTSALLAFNIIWVSNKGLIFHDESWELLHYQKGVYTIDYSNWHRVLKFLYLDNLAHLRQLTFAIVGTAAFFLGYVASKVFKFFIPAPMVGLLFFIAQFFLTSPVKMVPSYTNMNFALVAFSSSLLLLFFYGDRLSKARYFYLVSSAFFISVLPFVLITNSVVILLTMVLILVLSDAEQRITNIGIFTSGMLIYPAIYFLFIQSPENFWTKYLEAKHHLGFDSDYGVIGIVKWNLKLLLLILQIPILIFASFYILLIKNNLPVWSRHVALIVLVAAITLELITEGTNDISIFPATLWYVILTIMLYLNWDKLKLNKKYFFFILFFSLLPYFLSLGTVVRFQYRASSFFPFILVSITCLLRITDRFALFGKLTIGLFVFCLLNFFTFNFRTGWSNYNVLTQTIPYKISETKGTVLLSDWRVEELKDIRPYIYNNARVMTSHENVWGYVYLSNATPLYLPFRFRDGYFFYFVNEHRIDPKTVTFLEMKRKPFSKDFIAYLNNLQNAYYNLEVIDLKTFVVYRFIPIIKK